MGSPLSPEARKLLLDAADRLDKPGRWGRDEDVRKRGRECAWIALRPQIDGDWTDSWDARCAMTDYARAHGFRNVADWNDAQPDAASVTRVLREVAAEGETEGTKG